MLQNRIDGHLSALQNETLDPKAALYLTEAFSFLVQEKEQDYLIKTTRTYLEKKDKSLVKELSNSDLEKREEAEKYFKENDYAQAYKCLINIKYKSVDDLADIYLCLLMIDGSFDDVFRYLNKSFNKVYLKQRGLYSHIIDTFSFIILELPQLDLKLKKNKVFELFTLYSICYFNFINRRKERINDLLLLQKKLQNYYAEQDNSMYRITHSLILIWNNSITEGIDNLNKIKKEDILNQDKILWEIVFKLLLVKKQFHSLLHIINKEHFFTRKELSPLYYATLHYLQEEYPTEYLRMPPELKETVEELVAEIDQMAIDYA